MNHPDGSDRAFDRSAYPVFAIVAVLALVHVARLALPPEADFRLLADLAFVPARVTFAFDQDAVLRNVAQAVSRGDLGAAEATLFLGGGPHWWTFVTYALLHGGAAHIVLNGVWLLAFGVAVCRRFGGLRFIVFFVFAAIAGAFAFYALHPFDVTPVIGASAAISGAMGAAVRFAFAPGAPLGGGFAPPRNLAAYRQPAHGLREILSEPRAMTFLALWFVGNFLFGVFAPIGAEGPIAWEAHIGGFLAGLLGFSLFDRPLPPRPEDIAQ
jgi:membrane associated rhomboid family serine protease